MKNGKQYNAMANNLAHQVFTILFGALLTGAILIGVRMLTDLMRG